nr:AccD [Caldesia parnassifolia]
MKLNGTERRNRFMKSNDFGLDRKKFHVNSNMKLNGTERRNRFMKSSDFGLEFQSKEIEYKEMECNDNLNISDQFGHLWVECEDCYGLNYKNLFKSKLYICEYCGTHLKMSSSDRIEFLVDPGTWDPLNEDMISIDPFEFDFEEETSSDPEEEETSSEDEEEISWDSEEEEETGPEEEEDMDPEDEEDPYRRRMRRMNAYRLQLGGFLRSKIEELNDALEEIRVEEVSERILSKEEPGDEVRVADRQERTAAIQENKKKLSDAIRELCSENWFPEDMGPEEETGPEEEEEPYGDRINSNQIKTGLTEAIQTGVGHLNGIPTAIGVMDFEFMGGSMGSVVGEKITRLIEYAGNLGLPLIIVCSSGGARMQEGSLSLMQMAKISSALYDFQVNKKRLYVPVLASPTTGGVTASFGMLGDILIGEPGALIAFAGKRVIEETLKEEVPEGSQASECLYHSGLLDIIIPRTLLKGSLSELLKLHGYFPIT